MVATWAPLLALCGMWLGNAEPDPYEFSETSLELFDDDEDDSWGARSIRRLPVRRALRPLTLPKDLFDVGARARYTTITQDTPVLGVALGAAYGVDDNLEVGLTLLRVDFSSHPETGLEPPTVFGRIRLSEGVFEWAPTLGFSVPLGDHHEAFFQVSALLRLGDLGRFELHPGVTAFLSGDILFQPMLPAELSFQIGDQLSLSLMGSASMPDATENNIVGRIGGGLSWTTQEKGGAGMEISLTVMSANIALKGTRADDPSFGNHTAVVLQSRFFIPNPYDSYGMDRTDAF